MEPKSGLKQDLISSLQEKLEIANDTIDSLETRLGLFEGVDKELKAARFRIMYLEDLIRDYCADHCDGAPDGGHTKDCLHRDAFPLGDL